MTVGDASAGRFEVASLSPIDPLLDFVRVRPKAPDMNHPANDPPKICQASADLAPRLSTR